MAGEIDEAWIEAAVERYRRIDARQADFDKALAATEVTVRSADGTVEVLVTAAGSITDVRILGALAARGNADLSRAVQEAVCSAAEAARWARRKLRAEYFDDYQPLRES